MKATKKVAKKAPIKSELKVTLTFEQALKKAARLEKKGFNLSETKKKSLFKAIHQNILAN